MRLATFILLAAIAAAIPGNSASSAGGDEDQLKEIFAETYDLISQLQRLEVIKESAAIMSMKTDNCSSTNNWNEADDDLRMVNREQHILGEMADLLNRLTKLQKIFDVGMMASQKLDGCTAMLTAVVSPQLPQLLIGSLAAELTPTTEQNTDSGEL